MTNKPEKKITLGLDPGIADTGYGIIESDGYKFTMLTCGSIKTAADLSLPDRLYILHEELSSILKNYNINLAGIEELFFSRNVSSAIKVGQARGVSMLTIRQANIQIIEVKPNHVKQAVTGVGNADKKQVGEMVKNILKLKEIPKPDDAADALAIAIAVSQLGEKYLS